MLNEDKIKLMANISMFENHQKKYISLVTRYFKSDYISRNLLRAFFGYTLCWALGFLLVILYRAEGIFASMDFAALQEQAVRYGKYYVAGLVCYLLIALIVSVRRYNRGLKEQKIYIAKLRRLEKRYEFQNRTKELGKEVRRHDRNAGI
ncbi:MAG: hypothetical protein HFG65_00540 [Hungatella sp.]|nr:hypothetical protein [Hungatella sp.]